jgi:sugar-specific transcriptional regulator TrmB
MALYGIKTGSDLSLKVCRQVTADGAAKGQATPSRTLVDDEILLSKIKDQTDKYLKKLNDPPDAFADSNQKLQQLNAVYNYLNTAAKNPTGTIQSFSEMTQKNENEFLAAVETLKKSLTPELAEELKIAKLKYKGLTGL